MTPFPGEIERVGNYKRYVLNYEQEEWLRKWFPIIENTRLMKASGMCHSTLHRFARLYNLSKSEKGIKAIKRRQAAAIKRTCEKNGWYDSLRGKRPSQACWEGYQRRLRSPEFKSSIRIMRETNPRKYKKYIRKCSERRKEVIRKERMRQRFGVAQKTNLHLPTNPYTRRQVAHRYFALQRGYMVNADRTYLDDRWVIFYDDNTKRAPIFEKNCIADGFRFEYLNE